MHCRRRLQRSSGKSDAIWATQGGWLLQRWCLVQSYGGRLQRFSGWVSVTSGQGGWLLQRGGRFMKVDYAGADKHREPLSSVNTPYLG